MARRVSFFVLVSLLAALASAQQNYKLNGELVAPRPVAGDVDSAAFSPDGSRIVYLADQDTLGKVELFSVPSDGSAPAVRLNGPLEDGGEVPEFRIDSTGQRVVFRVRPTADYQFELHSAPIDGSAGAIRLSKPSTPDEYPLYFELTPDGKRVVYLTSGSTGNSRHRLYSASVDGAEPAVPLTVFPGYVFEFELSPDGERVAFSADVTGNGNLNVYSVRIGGWSAGHAQRLPRPRPVRLSPPESVVYDFLVSPDGARVVFDDSHTDVLYSVPIGGGSPVPLHGPMVTNGRPIDFQVAPGRVVYVADAEEDETFELFSVPIDGSSFPVELHSHPEEDRDVFNDFRITPDGARVVFRADLRANDVRELFVAPVDGSAAAVPVLATPRSIGTWELAGNGTHVAFTSGLDCQTALFGASLEGNALAVRLNGTPLGICDEENEDENYFRYHVTPDGARVLYISDEGVDEQYELYSVPLAGGLTADGHALALPRPRAVRLNAPLLPGRHVSFESDEFWFAVSADGAQVAYRAQQDLPTYELYHAPVDGRTAPVKVNPTLALGPPPGDVTDAKVSPDGSWVVYLADQEVDQRFELYSVPIGGGAAVKLNGPLWSEGSVGDYEIAPESERVVYVATLDSSDQLFSAPIDGSGEPANLSAPLVADGDVRSFELAPDGSRVAFVADRETDGQLELWITATDGSTAPMKLSGTLPPDGDVVPCSSSVHPHGHFTPDAARILYLADGDGDGFLQLFGVPTDGSALPVELSGVMTPGGGVGYFATCFQITANGERVVYQANQDTNDVWELYSAPTDGSAPAIKLNDALVTGGDVSVGLDGVHLSPLGDRVVYLADRDVNELYELFSVPVDGSAAPVEINGALITQGDVSPLVRISPDGTRVVYRADAEFNERYELYSVPIDGSAAPVKLSALPANNRSVVEFALAGAGTHVVYRADQDTDQVFELHAAPIDGASAPRKLTGPCGTFQVQPDGRGVVFSTYGISSELYHVPLRGGLDPVRLSGPMAGSGVIGSGSAFTPDGERVLYLADQDAPGIVELYASFLPGNHAPAAPPDGVVTRAP